MSSLTSTNFPIIRRYSETHFDHRGRITDTYRTFETTCILDEFIITEISEYQYLRGLGLISFELFPKIIHSEYFFQSEDENPTLTRFFIEKGENFLKILKDFKTLLPKEFLDSSVENFLTKICKYELIESKSLGGAIENWNKLFCSEPLKKTLLNFESNFKDLYQKPVSEFLKLIPEDIRIKNLKKALKLLIQQIDIVKDSEQKKASCEIGNLANQLKGATNDQYLDLLKRIHEIHLKIIAKKNPELISSQVSEESKAGISVSSDKSEE